MSGSLVFKDLLMQAHTGEIIWSILSCKTSQNVLNQPFDMCKFNCNAYYCWQCLSCCSSAGMVGCGRCSGCGGCSSWCWYSGYWYVKYSRS